MGKAKTDSQRGRWNGSPRGRAAGHRRRWQRGRRAECADCTLDRLRAGDTCRVSRIDDETARVQALRFGMGEGSRVSCVTRIPAGPVILKSGRQEIAVGHGLAQRIEVHREDRSVEAAS
jgi:Fe2+ transport system protein FeoA